MKFTFNEWTWFCHELSRIDLCSIPACAVEEEDKNAHYIVLKHDIETKVKNALRMAAIEKEHGHRGSYYVQAYLLKDKRNIDMLKQIQAMGHEVSYHYDVMDSTKGNIEKAILEFEHNKRLFEDNGFMLKTVCQHGNPVMDRVGYTSNRDFFRNLTVQKKYPAISDVMVNYKEKVGTDYGYYSDAGRQFKLIFDPINNDIINSDHKNVGYADLQALINAVLHSGLPSIISIHPHRWASSAMLVSLKSASFRVIKTIAKALIKVSVLNKLMSKYYYLAKKF